MNDYLICRPDHRELYYEAVADEARDEQTRELWRRGRNPHRTNTTTEISGAEAWGYTRSKNERGETTST